MPPTDALESGRPAESAWPAGANQRDLPHWLAIAAVILIIARIAQVFIGQRESGGGSLVQWTPIDAAVHRAVSAKRPILYDFTAAWCAPCRQLDHAVYADRALAQRINAVVVPVRVVDRQQEEGANPPNVDALQREYHVTVFPTVIVAASDGTELGRMEGFGGVKVFEKLLQRGDATRAPQ